MVGVDVDAQDTTDTRAEADSLGLDTRVRPPTTNAWVASLVTVVAFGEIGYEWYNSGKVQVFRYTFTTEAGLNLSLGLGALVIIMVLWLLLLYLRPGRLRIVVDPGADLRPVSPAPAGLIIERRLGGVSRRIISAPAETWKVQVLFFDQKNRERSCFKRLQLSCGSSFREVLLFGDFAAPERAVERLIALEQRLESLQVSCSKP